MFQFFHSYWKTLLKNCWKMEQWNENENIISIENETCEIFLNDVPMEKMFENDPSLEIESNKVYQNEKEKMKMSL